jgi:hypothetical protein
MNNQALASFAGTIATTAKAAGKTTYAGPTRAEYEAMLDSTAPSPTFNQATSAAKNHALTDARSDLQCVYDALIAKNTFKMHEIQLNTRMQSFQHAGEFQFYNRSSE